MLTWLREHAGRIGAGAVALVGSFAAGHFTVAEPEIKTVERVVYRDRVVEKRVVEKAEAKRVVVYRDRTVSPDGTRHEREVERTESDTHTGSTTVRAESHEGSTSVEVTVTPARPQWRVSLLGGVQLRLDPLGASPVGGLAVERRLVGPFFVGGWALYPGPSAGLSLSVEF